MVTSLGLKAWMGVPNPPPPSLGSKLIYACLQRLISSIGFQNAVQDLMPLGDSLDELIEDCLFEIIDEVAPQCPLPLGIQS